jgi:DNA-binding SARP family transcriptional activator/tetratricopeptide (TPR) repeat protein
MNHLIEVKVLGSWEVSAGRTTVPIPPGHLRSLFAAMLLTVGQPVRIDTLAERLWGERQPANVRGTLSTYITRLRRLLGSDAIVSYPGGGYSLYLHEDDVDLHRFRSLLRRSRDAGTADNELVLLHQALGLWRGRPFTGVESGWLDRDVVPALTEEWFSATERRIDLDLARGASNELIAELWQLTNNYSLRESLWLRLISTLHRSGRRADALTAYQQVRAILRDDLGIDPGEQLQQLHQAVLCDGPMTETQPTTIEVLSGPHQLPHDNVTFVGRERDLAALDSLVANVDGAANHPTVIVAIDGAPGTGKTTLAVHWAHRVKHQYPDVQLYLNLRGYSAGEPVRPAAAMEAVLRSLGVPTDHIPAELEERSALLRSTLAGRRPLILLDNARDAAQVRALLPGAGSLVIVTSRNQLRALTIRDGARRLTLRRLSHSEAVELLGAAAGRQRVAEEPEAAGQLAELCDCLPLALAIVAERTQRADTLSQVVRALTDEMATLDNFGSGTDADLHAALSWSYRTLDPRAAALFRKLGLHPANDISLAAAAALADLPISQAKQALDQLVDAHMVEQRRSNRYELHDLIRLYATEEARRTESAEDIDAAIRRVLDWYLHAGVSADKVLVPNRRRDFVQPFVADVPPPRFANQEQALAWFEQEFDCLRSVVRWTASNGRWGGRGWRIAIAMATFLDRRIAWREGAELLEMANQAARAVAVMEMGKQAAQAAGDRVGEGFTLNSMACIQIDRGDHKQARDTLEQALDCFKDSSHRAGVMMALTNLSLVLILLDEPEQGLQVATYGQDIARGLGYQRGVANSLDNMGLAYAAMGDHETAIDCYLRADDLYMAVGEVEQAACNMHELGRAYAITKQYAKSIRALRRAAAYFQQLGSLRWLAAVRYDLGNTISSAGHPQLARGCWEAALVEMRQLADPRARELEQLLAESR